MSSPLRLGQLLLREGFVSHANVDVALRRQQLGSRKPIGRLLVEQGAIDEATLAHALAYQFGLPLLLDEGDLTPEPEALAKLPRDAALDLQALPLALDDDRLVMVVAEPPTRDLRKALAQHVPESVRFAVAPADLLFAALTRWYPTERGCNASPLTPPDDLATLNATAWPQEEAAPGLDEDVQDRVVTWLLDRAHEHGATTLHLDGEPDGVWVRCRGADAPPDDLHLPGRVGTTLVARLLRAAGLDPDADGPQHGRVDATGEHEVTVTSARTHLGWRIVVRLATVDDALGALGFDRVVCGLAREAVRTSGGLVVVSGLDGCERAAIMRALVTESDPTVRSVITIEQPPGPLIPRTAQLRLDEATGVTPLSALGAAAALDADVVAIDAPADDRLVGAAVHAALSGRLVILVVDSPNARLAIQRLVAAVEPFIVAAAVTFAIGHNEAGDCEALVVSDSVRDELLRSAVPVPVTRD